MTTAPGVQQQVQQVWINNKTYALRDVVQYNGSSYVNIQPANTGNVPDQSPLHWALLAVAGAYVEPVADSIRRLSNAPGAPYTPPGQIRATGAPTPGVPGTPDAGAPGAYDAASFPVPAPLYAPCQEWIQNRVYAVYDVVTRDGSIYVSAQSDNHNHVPDQSTAFWMRAGATQGSGATGAPGVQDRPVAPGPGVPLQTPAVGVERAEYGRRVSLASFNTASDPDGRDQPKTPLEADRAAAKNRIPLELRSGQPTGNKNSDGTPELAPLQTTVIVHGAHDSYSLINHYNPVTGNPVHVFSLAPTDDERDDFFNGRGVDHPHGQLSGQTEVLPNGRRQPVRIVDQELVPHPDIPGQMSLHVEIAPSDTRMGTKVLAKHPSQITVKAALPGSRVSPHIE